MEKTDTILHSFVMVFASLVEYAVVSYMAKRMVLKREKKRKVRYRSINL